jgi:hypothetical protein
LTTWPWGGMGTRLPLSSGTRLFILVSFGTTLASLLPTLNSGATMQRARRRQKFCDLTRSSVSRWFFGRLVPKVKCSQRTSARPLTCARQDCNKFCFPERHQAHRYHLTRPSPTTFRPRLARRQQGRIGVSFSPAVSNKALRAVRRAVRLEPLPQRNDKSLDDLARMFNPIIRGWINYYGHYYKSALYPTLRHTMRNWHDGPFGNASLCADHRRRARHWLDRAARRQSGLFAHWALVQGRGRGAAEQWEPDEPQGSRPVLRERRGEIPLRSSPGHHL